MTTHKKGFFHSKAQNAAFFAAISAAFLVAGKLGLFFFTGSLVVALSTWDSVMDVIVSLANRQVIQFARIDADHNHPYGHGRAESIAALAQGCIITAGAVAIIISSVKQISHFFSTHELPKVTTNWWVVLFFVFASCVSIAVTFWLRKTGEMLHSPALLADAQHYQVDYITNLCSGFSIALVMVFHNPMLDPILAFVFSLYIIYGASKLISTSINELMDHDLSDEIKNQAMEIIQKSDDRIIDIHNFRGRKSGHRYFFDLHVTLPEELSFHDVHLIIEKIEKAVQKEFRGDVVAHADPSSVRLTKNDL